jgi:hypothetical protein
VWFDFYFSHNRSAGTLQSWIRKKTGEQELIAGTYFATPGNDINKGWGAASNLYSSVEGYQRDGEWDLDKAAEQNGYDVLDAHRVAA